MRRVVTVSLNGNAYQLEEDACSALSAYMDQAARALADDPDKGEIIADLEQAIADKCQRRLSAHKSVLTRAEIEQVIGEMGPVDGAGAPAEPSPGAQRAGTATAGAAAAGATPPGGTGAAPRRLYQIREGAMISGLCNGIAAYFDIDVTVVRVIAVALAFLSFGLAALLYLVLMFIVPDASTSEERAAAHGLPFNAQLLVERAKQKYREFAHGGWQQASADWKRDWRRSRRHARAEWRAARRQARHEWRAAPVNAAPATGPVHYGAQVFGGVIAVVVGLLAALFMLVWLAYFLSFITTGAFFGVAPPFQAPFWVVVVLMFVAYGMVVGPLRAVRRAANGAAHYPLHPWFAALDGLVMLVVVVAALVYASHHGPEIRDFLEHLRDAVHAAIGSFSHGTGASPGAGTGT